MIKKNFTFIMICLIIGCTSSCSHKDVPTISCDNQEYPYSNIEATELRIKESKEVNISIIDTGIALNDLCFEDIDINYYSVVDGLGNEDVFCEDNNNKHGTYVSGIISTCFRIQYRDLIGKIHINVIKVGDDTNIDINNLITGIYKAIDLNSDVISISLGVYVYNENLRKAINEAINANIVIIAAAGNDSTTQMIYPASYEGVISVTSVDENNVALLNNNENGKITISIPGELIDTGIKMKDSNDTILISGTSAATALLVPFVSILRLYDDVSSQEVIKLIRLSSNDVGEIGYDNLYGYGVFNSKKINEEFYKTIN